jgi:CheY-like chemotaxis protein
MDEEAKAHIFDPFFTTKPRGSGIGLGLATVYGIVKQSGGWIWVYSEPGNGATFKIYLPRIHAETKLPEQLSPPVQPVAGKETILVIEDQPNVRRLAVTMLQAYNYTVIEAAGPEEALWICEQTDRPIDLILTDVVMPGLSGPEVVERVKHFRPQIGVVFMSGYTEDIVVHRGVLTANMVYLAKPFTAQDLTAKVRQGLAMRPIGAGGVS